MATTNLNEVKRDNKLMQHNIPTGDSFVDVGGLVLETIRERFSEKTLPEIFDFVIDVYIERWNQKLHSIFHTNSKILNPSTKGKHKANTRNYLNELLANSWLDDCLDGYCKTCGKHGILYSNSREFLPISGSGAFVNFHHSHEPGSFLCNQCSIKLFFVPLGVILFGGNAGLLDVQAETIRNFWKKNIILENLNKISKNSSEGILKSDYKNPKNALFNFASDIIDEIKDENHSEFLQLLCFTNFGASPHCDIYFLPNPVFVFLNKVICHYASNWYYFVNRYFFIKGVKWDDEQRVWVKETKKEKTVLTKSDYLNNKNLIYEKLLSKQSILRELLKIYRGHYMQNLGKFPLEITIHYTKEVLNMDKKQIEMIGRISDVIFELSRKENNFKKYLVMLERAGKAYQLRSALIRIIKANFRNGAKEPLIRLEDYVTYLFPDGQYWGEIRDLLLIHLYEKFHDEGVNRDTIPEVDVVEAEDDAVNEF